MSFIFNIFKINFKNMTKDLQNKNNKIAIFEWKQVRKILHKNEWWFSVVDIIWILEASKDPRNYWKVLKHRIIKEWWNQTVTNCNQLKMLATDWKMRLTDYANTETCLKNLKNKLEKTL